MANEKHINDEKYAGPSKTIEVLGKGNAASWMGSISGLVIGGVAAALSTKENSTMAIKGKEFVTWVSHGRINISGKWPVIIGSALLGSQLAHWVTYFIGMGHAARNSGKGQEQFERMKVERRKLKAEIELLKAERDAGRKEAVETIASAEAPRHTIATHGSEHEGMGAEQDIALDIPR